MHTLSRSSSIKSSRSIRSCRSTHSSHNTQTWAQAQTWARTQTEARAAHLNSSSAYKPATLKKVHFDTQSHYSPDYYGHHHARQALRTLKQATNRRIDMLKNYWRPEPTSFRAEALRPPSQFVEYKSCLKLNSLFDRESIMDMSVEHALIDTVWQPLQPKPFKMHLDLEGLFN